MNIWLSNLGFLQLCLVKSIIKIEHKIIVYFKFQEKATKQTYSNQVLSSVKFLMW